MDDPLCGIGRNYLDSCDNQDNPETHSIAEGIRRVLRGHLEKFEFDYPCHSPTEQRWFLALVTPLGTFPGAVVMHVDVTVHHFAPELMLSLGRGQRKIARLLEMQSCRLREAQAIAKLGSWEADLMTGEVDYTDQLLCILETDQENFRPAFPGVLQWVHPEDRARVREVCLTSIDKGGPFSVKHRLPLAGGRTKLVEHNWEVFRREGTLLRALGTCRDISDAPVGHGPR